MIRLMTLTKTDLQAIDKLLNHRLRDQNKYFEGQLAKTRQEINTDIGDAIERGFNRVDERIDDVEGALEKMGRKLNSIDDRLDRYDKTDEDHEKRIKKLEKVYSSA